MEPSPYYTCSELILVKSRIRGGMGAMVSLIFKRSLFPGLHNKLASVAFH